MPTDITNQERLECFFMDLYDGSDPDMPLSVIAERIIDITDICDKTIKSFGQTVIKYGRRSSGRVAQIQNRSTKGNNDGVVVNLCIEGTSAESLSSDFVLELWSGFLESNPDLLAGTIFEYAPEENKML